MSLPVRTPYVAGSFYPAETDRLRKYLADQLEPLLPSLRPRAVILPHAGYVYSGATASEVVRRVEIPALCFLIGPNHRGKGEAFALFPKGTWQTPLGTVSIDSEFASGLLEASHDLRADCLAHEEEHSLEVEMPFLQYRNPEVKIVPLLIGTRDLGRAREAALSLVEFLKGRSSFLMVVSSDMDHYESDSVTRRKDRYAIQAIESLDEKALAKAVQSHQISMCGFVPVYLTLIVLKALGAEKAVLVDYRTSADASGDYDRVVGYAGFIIE